MVSERKNDLIRFTGFNEMEGNTVMGCNNRSEKSKLNYMEMMKQRQQHRERETDSKREKIQ